MLGKLSSSTISKASINTVGRIRHFISYLAVYSLLSLLRSFPSFVDLVATFHRQLFFFFFCLFPCHIYNVAVVSGFPAPHVAPPFEFTFLRRKCKIRNTLNAGERAKAVSFPEPSPHERKYKTRSLLPDSRRYRNKRLLIC